MNDDDPVWRSVTVHTYADGEQTLYLKDSQTVCGKCKGAGAWDSCFHCGNRGYHDRL